jgi:hypothetical protein
MKKIIIIIFAFSILFVGCSKDEIDNSVKGLVSFASDPVYSDDKINFTAQVQFSSVGEAVDIEFQLMDGDIVLLSEALSTENADGGVGLFFKTAEVAITLNSSANLLGKELTVWLDPENKVTASEYTDDMNVNLWKKESVSIP